VYAEPVGALFQNHEIRCDAMSGKVWIATHSARALAFGGCDRVPDAIRSTPLFFYGIRAVRGGMVVRIGEDPVQIETL
jgi:hypothetical protein